MGRALWKGSINFGLVNIAIQLETAIREKNIRFHMLAKDGSCRLRQKLVCPESGQEFNFNETARGVEVAPNQYVLIDQEEFDRIKPARGRTIEIEKFVSLDEIDPIYFDAVYFITPAEDSLKAYRLFTDALREHHRAGVARFVMHERQHMAAIRVMGDGLVLHTMHYADEVLSLVDTLPPAMRQLTPPAAELKIARQLIDAMTRRADLRQYKDDYREQLEAVIELKKRGKVTTAVSEEQRSDSIPHTINLMAALKRSLAARHRELHGTHSARRRSA